mmetsp:Transcript_70166/g.216994  ORF Transcript_70166/g.216994 Transcript_70166/m.216994 type:complete len:176 (-) Transcript_70166:201-728(-)|eukprot:CAMPEP_0204594620 /NCGR_PEP_ID=MMETSP0661-20131031/52187_1 /ASSEMBLY_ACC=CAM_ASM_000606 /TAXON_ID=109239 /ORGANISM="Alexandrium margalefi, Strain AMGDE01CS-322" /LENGTH=175 /DNA_ID=CAMNT_0051605039 /DNA_START=35 /DNA_END=562 /DNA_ORIENTATION=+
MSRSAAAPAVLSGWSPPEEAMFKAPTGDAEWAATMDELRSPSILGWIICTSPPSVVRAERGRTVVRMPVDASTGAGAGSSGGMHGGILAALLDMTGTHAAFSVMRQGQVGRGTVNMEISYLRPAVGKYVEATAVVKKPGNTVSTVYVDIHNDEGKLLCSGRILYAVGDASPAAKL